LKKLGDIEVAICFRPNIAGLAGVNGTSFDWWISHLYH
jgi:hypothetical protein